jgi:hypothetical protein
MHTSSYEKAKTKLAAKLAKANPHANPAWNAAAAAFYAFEIADMLDSEAENADMDELDGTDLWDTDTLCNICVEMALEVGIDLIDEASNRC